MCVSVTGCFFVMAALCNRADHYIFALWFLLSFSSFFPRLISAVADWMFTILLHTTWPQCEFRMQVQKAHPCIFIVSNLVLKTLRLVAPTLCSFTPFHLLITLFEKKYFQQSRVHISFANLSQCPLVPILFTSTVNSTWSLIFVIPLDILNISIRSCLFRFSCVRWGRSSP